MSLFSRFSYSWRFNRSRFVSDVNLEMCAMNWLYFGGRIIHRSNKSVTYRLVLMQTTIMVFLKAKFGWAHHFLASLIFSLAFVSLHYWLQYKTLWRAALNKVTLRGRSICII